MRSWSDGAKLLMMGALYAYAGNNIVCFLLAPPIYFQWVYFDENAKITAKLQRSIVRVAGITYFFGGLIYLYSLNYKLDERFFFEGMSDVRRLLTAIGSGVFVSLLILTFESVHKRVFQ
jgi:hypothetical protein